MRIHHPKSSVNLLANLKLADLERLKSYRQEPHFVT